MEVMIASVGGIMNPMGDVTGVVAAAVARPSSPLVLAVAWVSSFLATWHGTVSATGGASGICSNPAMQGTEFGIGAAAVPVFLLDNLRVSIILAFMNKLGKEALCLRFCFRSTG
ncbi:hypothetical protein PS1_038040 [Malus domestica]